MIYGLERTVYRLSISEYAPQFTLKGGIFLYALFDGEFIRATRDITEFKEYHGVHVSIMAYLDKTKVPVSIDIGFNDVIYPDRVKIEFPISVGWQRTEGSN